MKDLLRIEVVRLTFQTRKLWWCRDRSNRKCHAYWLILIIFFSFFFLTYLFILIFMFFLKYTKIKKWKKIKKKKNRQKKFKNFQKIEKNEKKIKKKSNIFLWKKIKHIKKPKQKINRTKITKNPRKKKKKRVLQRISSETTQKMNFFMRNDTRNRAVFEIKKKSDFEFENIKKKFILKKTTKTFFVQLCELYRHSHFRHRPSYDAPAIVLLPSLSVSEVADFTGWSVVSVCWVMCATILNNTASFAVSTMNEEVYVISTECLIETFKLEKHTTQATAKQNWVTEIWWLLCADCVYRSLWTLSSVRLRQK